MVDNKKSGSKILPIGIIIGIILICVVLAIAYLVLFSGILGSHDHVIKLRPAQNAAINESQQMAIKGILLSRFTEYGYPVRVDRLNDSQRPYLLVHYGDMPSDLAATIATTPGVFEMRIQGNGSEYVLSGSDIEVASAPTSNLMGQGQIAWGVDLGLTKDGAAKFRQMCIDSGATADPANHGITTMLDGRVISVQPLSNELASAISIKPVDSIAAMMGTGDTARADAKLVSTCIRSGAMPVKMEIATS